MSKVIKVIMVVFALVDLAVVDGWLVYKSQAGVANNSQVANSQVDVCGSDCRAYIDQQLAARITPAAPAGESATPKPQVVTTVQTIPAKKVTSVSYVPVPGSGSSVANDWADVTGTDFYFNTADFPGLVSVYFEANMALMNGNGTAFVRLFDVTHGIGVQGSDVQTSSQTNNLVTSGQVAFWSGKNLIRVQAKSLTADTAVYTSGRLRITTQN